MSLGTLLVLAAMVLGSVAQLGGSGPYTVECSTISISTLTALLPIYRSARTCYPVPGHGNFSLHLLIHGNLGGGPFGIAYHSLQEQIASFGFVVAFFNSCFSDSQCNNGESSFLEAANTLRHFEMHPSAAPVDFQRPYTISGHSTGARAALMIGAIVDSPSYLSASELGAKLTPELRASLSRVRAVVADHPDPMYDPKQNPDIGHWNVTQMPVLVITGTKDKIEPNLSGWRDFCMLATPDKVFVDISGASHLQPILAHPEGPFVAYFAQAFGLGNATATQLFYSNQSGSLANAGGFRVAQAGEGNTGQNGTVGFLACRRDGSSMPPGLQALCA